MSYDLNELIKLRIIKAKKTLEVANLLIQRGYWNSAANRLYYTIFYAVLALFAKENIRTRTHSGAKTEFFRSFIKTEIFDRKFSKLYTDLFNKRQEGDYDDFAEFSEDDIKPLLPEVEQFILTIEKYLSIHQ